MKFLSRLVTVKHTKPGDFVLYRDFLIEFMYQGSTYRTAVPRGFITDFGSIPKLAQLLPGFGVNDDSAYSSVWHDMNYCNQGQVRARDMATGELITLQLTRAECDMFLYEGLLCTGYNCASAYAFYAAVRVGGWLYWRKRKDGIDDDYDFVPDDYVYE